MSQGRSGIGLPCDSRHVGGDPLRQRPGLCRSFCRRPPHGQNTRGPLARGVNWPNGSQGPMREGESRYLQATAFRRGSLTNASGVVHSRQSTAPSPFWGDCSGSWPQRSGPELPEGIGAHSATSAPAEACAVGGRAPSLRDLVSPPTTDPGRVCNPPENGFVRPSTGFSIADRIRQNRGSCDDTRLGMRIGTGLGHV